MERLYQESIAIIRRFNRYYTNILGLLDRHILDSDLSLSEVRVLHEIGKTEHCTSKMLTDILSIDAGYLSRILKKFYRMELVSKEKSPKDGRAQELYLTDKGMAKMKELNISSDEQISQLIKPLTPRDQKRLVKDMTSIETILTNGCNIKLEDIIIRNEIHSGDIGYIIHMHGWMYLEECGYSREFEGYVIESFVKFASKYNPNKERLWCAEHNGNIIGCIAIVDGGTQARLRWFLIDPHYRKIGLGKKLFQEALSFAREKDYKSIYLSTTLDQETAIRMYTKAGFVKISEKENHSWRDNITELEYELKL